MSAMIVIGNGVRQRGDQIKAGLTGDRIEQLFGGLFDSGAQLFNGARR